MSSSCRRWLTTTCAPCCARVPASAGWRWPATWWTTCCSHFSRDLGSLVQLLDRLDAFALRTQRAVTVPLLKSMLQGE